VTKQPDRPIDWRQVCDDLAYLLADDPLPGTERVPLGTKRLACALGYSRSWIRLVRDGMHPRYEDGAKLLDRWCSLTNKSREFIPRA
jgi:hypothetical protein